MMARARYDENAPTVDGLLEMLERITAKYDRRARKSAELLAELRQRIATGKQPTKAQFQKVNSLIGWRDDAADDCNKGTLGDLHLSLAHCATVLTGEVIKDSKGNWVAA
jgi:hypothetical protein